MKKMGHTINYCPTVQLTWTSFKDKPGHKIECNFDPETHVNKLETMLTDHMIVELIRLYYKIIIIRLWLLFSVRL